VLFNPQQGFRYLSEYDGHWTDIAVIDKTPETGRHRDCELDGRTFRLFQTARARTAFVLGEFPWVVRIGEKVQVKDYTAPPLLLSREGTGKEATWSLGTYVRGEELWRAFSVPGAIPRRVGVYVNQPSPFEGRVSPHWYMFGVAALLIVAALVRAVAAEQTVFDGRYVFDPSSPNPAFVTESFTLDGRPSSRVAVSFDTTLSNSWMNVNLALINEDTNVALDFNRELEYYFGVEDGESWSSGSTRGRVVVPTVPAGRYYLRVEPEGDLVSRLPVSYSLQVRRDTPVGWLYGGALALLALPPLFITWRRSTFERQRWAESDYGEEDD
jgi:hypothetical protein